MSYFQKLLMMLVFLSELYSQPMDDMMLQSESTAKYNTKFSYK